MKSCASTSLLSFAAVASVLVAGDSPKPSLDEAEQRERLFERFVSEMVAAQQAYFPVDTNTNEQRKLFRTLFDQIVIHPSFGLHWDEVPPPALTGSNAMNAVHAFIATNGWNMFTG